VKFSEYGIQLREKQKIKRMYGLLEGQFRATFDRAEKSKGVTGSNLVSLLESRLDNTVYRLGFASSRTEARHLVRHGHFEVNGKRVDIPSFAVTKGDKLTVREKSRNLVVISAALESVKRRVIPQWLELDAGNMRGVVRDMPSRDDVTAEMEERLVVELYSK
jgi:small subunit ribosomal protein S4